MTTRKKKPSTSKRVHVGKASLWWPGILIALAKVIVSLATNPRIIKKVTDLFTDDQPNPRPHRKKAPK